MNQQVLLQALALVVSRIGYVVRGGREIYVSDEAVAQLSEHGQLQLDRHPDKPGYVIRYFKNKTIEGAVPDGGFIQHTQADDQGTIGVVDSVRNLRGGEVSEADTDQVRGAAERSEDSGLVDDSISES